MADIDSGPEPVKAQLGLWDTASIIIGIIIGATIYETPPFIYNNLPGVGWALGIWVLVGALSLIGALCYAELATTYPRSGGDYNYLTRAYGSWMGFLFAWAQLTVIHTGGIGLIAYIFGGYADRTRRIFAGPAPADVNWPLAADAEVNWPFVFAAVAVAVLTVMNLLGIVLGKITQNVLTVAKVVGLAAILIAAFLFAQPARVYTEGEVVRASADELVVKGKEGEVTFRPAAEVAISGIRESSKFPPLEEGKSYRLEDVPAGAPVRVTAITPDRDKAVRVEETGPSSWPGFGLAMVLVFLAFSGYNDAAYVAAEVRDRRRNLVLALVLGVAGVTVIYLLINVAYIYALGFEEARRSREIAAEVLKLPDFGINIGERRVNLGELVMCLIVMVSALGAINGSILTGSRIFAALGADHRLFAPLGYWNARLGSPIPALIVQGLVALALIGGVGTQGGQDAINQAVTAVWLPRISWGEGRGGFDTLLKFTTPIFWLFFMLTGLAVFVLREKDRHIERPFKVPLYPLLPLVFVGTSIYMLYSGIGYAGVFGLIGTLLLVLGLVLYVISGRPPAEVLADKALNAGEVERRPDS